MHNAVSAVVDQVKKGERVEIHLDTPAVAGQVLEGRLHMSFARVVNVQNMRVELMGEAHCMWTSKKGVKFSGYQRFFHYIHIYFTEEHESPLDSALLGTTNFNFKVALPFYLPGTWVGEHGDICYILIAKRTLLGSSEEIFERHLYVQGKRDLQLEQHLRLESRVDCKRTFNFAGMNHGTTHISVWVPLTGLAPGQSLPIVCTVVNNSKVNFSGIIFVLTMVECYLSNVPYAKVLRERTDVTRLPRIINISDERAEFFCDLKIPTKLPPTKESEKCDCCQVVYELWVSLEASLPEESNYGYNKIDTPVIPLIIGTSPVIVWESSELAKDVIQSIHYCGTYKINEPILTDDEVVQAVEAAEALGKRSEEEFNREK